MLHDINRIGMLPTKRPLAGIERAPIKQLGLTLKDVERRQWQCRDAGARCERLRGIAWNGCRDQASVRGPHARHPGRKPALHGCPELVKGIDEHDDPPLRREPAKQGMESRFDALGIGVGGNAWIGAECCAQLFDPAAQHVFDRWCPGARSRRMREHKRVALFQTPVQLAKDSALARSRRGGEA